MPLGHKFLLQHVQFTGAKIGRHSSNQERLLSVSVTKNQRNRGHGQKREFAHTLSVCRARQVTERYGVSF